MTAKSKSIYTLKVTLRGVKPPVWRRIVVDSQIPVSELSDVLEAAMGWLGGHLHLFDVDGVTYGAPDPEWCDEIVDERKARLVDVLSKVTSRMRWDYDFGDGWEHDVVVEAIGLPQASETYPLCVTGRRACPPEDCGGPWGYRDLLEALADPSHEDHDHMSEWVPPAFDPQRFDAEETTEAMRAARPLKGW